MLGGGGIIEETRVGTYLTEAEELSEGSEADFIIAGAGHFEFKNGFSGFFFWSEPLEFSRLPPMKLKMFWMGLGLGVETGAAGAG